MNLREFFSDPAIALPTTRPSDNDFQGFVDRLLDTFEQRLDALKPPSGVGDLITEQRTTIDAFCKAAKEVVKATLAGHPRDAYDSFEGSIDPLLPTLQRHELPNVDGGQLGILYRVRQCTGGMLSREGLFHIPFESRHLVKTQRYSIPGLPCLYLGGSLYTCWAEMGRPPFHELHAAAFRLAPSQTVKVLNLGNRPARLLAFHLDPQGYAHPSMDGFLAGHVILWPLLALCSIKTLHRDAPFKPEYILPQIVLQWITKKHAFDGLCYFSTHVDAVTDVALPPCNLVFPAREINSHGRCAQLRKLFRMTEPDPWELIRASAMGSAPACYAQPQFDFEFIAGYREQYYNTEFGNIQWKLNKMVTDIHERNMNGEPNLGMVAE